MLSYLLVFFLKYYFSAFKNVISQLSLVVGHAFLAFFHLPINRFSCSISSYKNLIWSLTISLFYWGFPPTILEKVVADNDSAPPAAFRIPLSIPVPPRISAIWFRTAAPALLSQRLSPTSPRMIYCKFMLSSCMSGGSP